MASYPPIEPFNTGMLPVSNVHTLYYEQVGNPKGVPVLFVHGGPGGGCSATDRCFFDPAFFRVVLVDQRGAGRSTPTACLDDNDTWALVADMERVRKHLGIAQWHVFGGSWGSTLSLVYAETHPEVVLSLTLRGIFMLRRQELIWFYQEGASFVFPEAFEKYASVIPEEERGDLIQAFYRRLSGSDEVVKAQCAKAWTTWEMTTSKLLVDPVTIERGEDPKFALAFARIEAHYFVNKGFFSEDAYVLNNVDRIRHIPTTIAQGRYDMVCPAKSAYDLKVKFPEAVLNIVPDAGHSAREVGITKALVAAMDAIRDKLRGEQQRQAPPAGKPTSAFDRPALRFDDAAVHVKGGPADPTPTVSHEIPETRFHESVPPRKGLAGQTIVPTSTFETPSVRFHEGGYGKGTHGNIRQPTSSFEHPSNIQRRGHTGNITQPTAQFEHPGARFEGEGARKNLGAIVQPTSQFENPGARFEDAGARKNPGAITQPTAGPGSNLAVLFHEPSSRRVHTVAGNDLFNQQPAAAEQPAGLPQRKALAPPGGFSSNIFG